MRLNEIKARAELNAIGRLSLIKEFEKILANDPTLRRKVDKVDDNFLRKIFHYQGDITAARIAKVLEKIGI